MKPLQKPIVYNKNKQLKLNLDLNCKQVELPFTVQIKPNTSNFTKYRSKNITDYRLTTTNQTYQQTNFNYYTTKYKTSNNNHNEFNMDREYASIKNNSKNNIEDYYLRKIRIKSSQVRTQPIRYYTPKSLLEYDIDNYINKRQILKTYSSTDANVNEEDLYKEAIIKSNNTNMRVSAMSTENNDILSTKNDENYLNTGFSNNNNQLLSSNKSLSPTYSGDQATKTMFKQSNALSMSRVLEIIKLKEDLKLKQVKQQAINNRLKESHNKNKEGLEYNKNQINSNTNNSEIELRNSNHFFNDRSDSNKNSNIKNANSNKITGNLSKNKNSNILKNHDNPSNEQSFNNNNLNHNYNSNANSNNLSKEYSITNINTPGYNDITYLKSNQELFKAPINSSIHLNLPSKKYTLDCNKNESSNKNKNIYIREHITKTVKQDNPLKDYLDKVKQKQKIKLKQTVENELINNDANMSKSKKNNRKSKSYCSNDNINKDLETLSRHSNITNNKIKNNQVIKTGSSKQTQKISKSSSRSMSKLKYKKDRSSDNEKEKDNKEFFTEESLESEYEYNFQNKKIEYFPPEVINIVRHQQENLKELFRNKTEFYDYIKACEDRITVNSKENKILSIFTKTEVKKPSKINNKDCKKAFQKKELTTQQKILKVFRNGIEQTQEKVDSFLQRKHFYSSKNSVTTIRTIRGKKEPTNKKVNYLSEIFHKTAKWIENQYLPISKKISSVNKQHIFALNRENTVRFGEEFQVADKKKFDEKYRACNDIEIDNKKFEVNRLLNKITNENQKLKKEVFNQVDAEINSLREKQYATKQEKWVRCVISAAIHFKRLNCTINEFYSKAFKISKPYSKEGSWNFFQAVKNNSEDVVFKMLLENKFLVHDFDYHKQTALHWAAKRNYSNILSLLISYGIKVDQTDSVGRTALHYASKNNHMESVIILLKNRADPLLGDSLGKTPSQLCTDESIIYYLKRIKALYIIYKNASTKEADMKIKRGIDYVFQHETLRIQKEKMAKKKRKDELGY